jgi:CheY-like chemotaxis protein
MAEGSEHAVILLVEDLDDDIFLIRRAFQKAEIHNPFHVVKDGEEAIAYLSGKGKYANRDEHPLPDLIMLDLKLPKMDGFEVLEWIRVQPGIRNIATLVLTSSNQLRDVNRAYALGANSFLVKPIDFDNYIELGKLLNKYWLKTVLLPESSRTPLERKGVPPRS